MKKIVPKPVTLIRQPTVPAIKALVTKPDAPKDRAYEQLVTSQDVHPDRAKKLLGLT